MGLMPQPPLSDACASGSVRSSKKAARQLAGMMQAKLSKIKRSELGANGVFLANDSTEGWLWSYACVQVIRPDIEDEPEHHDGGASLLLGSLTIWGRRQLVCRTSTGATAVEMDLQPGDVYVSPMCACRHQVLHGGHAGDLKRVKGLGSAKISVLLKCHAFRSTRCGPMARGPSPRLALYAAQDVLVALLQDCPLHLPSLDECTS